MFGGHFYHEKTRKAVALFGKLFNNLYVLRKNSSGGVVSQVKVPLSYAPKSKYLERIRENPDLTDDTKVAIIRTFWVLLHITTCLFIIIGNGRTLGFW